MKLIFEPGDFPDTSGLTKEALSSRLYGWSLMVKHVTGGRTVAILYRRGGNYSIDPERVTVEILSADGTAAEVVPTWRRFEKETAQQKKVSLARAEDGKFIKRETEPALTGPALPNTDDWYAEG